MEFPLQAEDTHGVKGDGRVPSHPECRPGSVRSVGAAPEPVVDLVLVSLTFDASDPDRLAAVLAKYVVLSRQEPGCRNIDLCGSLTVPARFVVIEKWETPTAQQAHFDGPNMVEMAEACTGLLRQPPVIDLLEGLSAHDLI